LQKDEKVIYFLPSLRGTGGNRREIEKGGGTGLTYKEEPFKLWNNKGLEITLLKKVNLKQYLFGKGGRITK